MFILVGVENVIRSNITCAYQRNAIIVSAHYKLTHSPNSANRAGDISCLRIGDSFRLNALSSYYLEDNIELAMRSLSEMMKLFPDNMLSPSYVRLSAKYYQEQGDLGTAIYLYSQSWDIDSLIALGNYGINNENWSLASDAYQNVLDIPSDGSKNFLAYLGLGRIWWYGYKDIHMAEELFSLAYKDAPDNIYICRAAANAWLDAGYVDKSHEWNSLCVLDN